MSGDTRGGRPGPEETAKGQRHLKRARLGWPPSLRELKDLLYEVYLAAGTPSLDAITGDIADDNSLDGAPRRDTVRRVISDPVQPPSQADVIAVAQVLARRAAWNAPDLVGRVRDLWVQALMVQGAGRPIGEFRGDVRLVLDEGLGIHPAWDTGGAHDRFGLLPTYISRDHDARLKAVVDAARDGRSGIAVLVGGSSTGKSHALWEAVRTLPDDWRLWHPLTPTAPDAALAQLPDIAPKTVVWLNETQHYLAPDPLGEQVAAGLRKLLNDPSRGPVLVLGTLWPDHWDTLTRITPDQHPGARALLSAHKIDVPDAFTPAHLAALDTSDDADPRLSQAIERAEEGKVTQYLAGVPYLMDRYGAARGATRALIDAAMDARRLGAGLDIPLDWLANAAPGYLTDTEYHALDPNWLPQALAYVTAPCNGIPGILTPVNTSRPRNQRTRSGPDPSPQGSQYLLADYLDQHGRRHRTEISPVDFWTAAVAHARPTDMAALGDAAWARGLYRDATQLHKHATTHGNPRAAATLIHHLHTLHPTDPRPAQWAAAHAALDDPDAVARLLTALRATGADEQITLLLARDPAANAALDDPVAVAELLQELRKAGAHEQLTVLAERAAAHTALDDPYVVARLLEALRGAGAGEQYSVLAERAAAHTALDDPYVVARLLQELPTAGAHEQYSVLAERAAATAALHNPDAVADLLQVLREAGAHEQYSVLAERAAATAALDDLVAVAWLLMKLRGAGAHEQFSVLAERAAAHAALDAPDAVARLLQELREAGEQVTVLLAERAAAHAALDAPAAVAWLLQELREAGAGEQFSVLAERAAAHAALDDLIAVGGLLQELRKAGAGEQFSVLAERAAAHAALDDLIAVGGLLQELRKAGAGEQ
ncbi:hypothetical protein, partial [Streptomyces sp. NPDC052192]|uniref:hypothetical protein n=1 Tax=Streptomyces sp. NPDC052192 TaxID=3155052 RepID=UPI003446EB75